MLAGNLGGVLTIVGMEWINQFGSGRPWTPAIYLMLVLLAAGMVVGVLIRETHPGRH
jgi:hypothetical protein